MTRPRSSRPLKSPLPDFPVTRNSRPRTGTEAGQGRWRSSAGPRESGFLHQRVLCEPDLRRVQKGCLVPIGIDRRFNAAPKRRRHEGFTALGIRFASDSLVEGKQDSKPRQVDGALFHSRWFTNGEKHRSHYSDIVGMVDEPPYRHVVIAFHVSPFDLIINRMCNSSFAHSRTSSIAA